MPDFTFTQKNTWIATLSPPTAHEGKLTALATGYNVIDCSYAKEKGIMVQNVPTYGTASMGQYAIALLLEICHHSGHHSQTVHDGKWAILINNARGQPVHEQDVADALKSGKLAEAGLEVVYTEPSRRTPPC